MYKSQLSHWIKTHDYDVKVQQDWIDDQITYDHSSLFSEQDRHSCADLFCEH